MMSPQSVEKLTKRNRYRTLIAFGLAWGFMMFCGYEIMIFSIQFNQNVSSLWMTTFSLATAYDMVVQMSFQTVVKVLAVRVVFD